MDLTTIGRSTLPGPVLAGVGTASMSAGDVGWCTAIVVFSLHMIVKHIVDSPLSIAAIFGVLGGKARREDAREMAKILCERPDDDPPAIDPPRRRRRRQRLRKRR